MQGANTHRYRWGDWRIVYEIRDQEIMIYVVNVDQRGRVYR